jgi:hypothetical protein
LDHSLKQRVKILSLFLIPFAGDFAKQFVEVKEGCFVID